MVTGTASKEDPAEIMSTQMATVSVTIIPLVKGEDPETDFGAVAANKTKIVDTHFFNVFCENWFPLGVFEKER